MPNTIFEIETKNNYHRILIFLKNNTAKSCDYIDANKWIDDMMSDAIFFP